MKGKSRRRILRTGIAIVAAGLLAIALSHMIYGRSLRASLYEIWMWRHFATDRTAAQEIERLAEKRAAGEPPGKLPSWLKLRSELIEEDRNGMPVYTLNEAGGARATVLYLHGGAYINGFNRYQCRFMDRLALAADCRVIAPAYHLAPHGDCARAYEDLTGLYRDIVAGNPGGRVLLLGDSAGGGLALGLAQALRQSGDPPPERLILFSPWVDVSMDNPEIEHYVPVEPILHLELVKVHGRAWAGAADVHDWRVSPLYGDMTGLPPVTVYCGTREILYPDIMLACEKLEAAGVPVERHVGRGLNHDYPLMPLPEGTTAVRAVVQLVRG